DGAAVAVLGTFDCAVRDDHLYRRSIPAMERERLCRRARRRATSNDRAESAQLAHLEAVAPHRAEATDSRSTTGSRWTLVSVDRRSGGSAVEDRARSTRAVAVGATPAMKWHELAPPCWHLDRLGPGALRTELTRGSSPATPPNSHATALGRNE